MAHSFFHFSDLRPNIKSGLTLALVAIPGAISLAVASGVTPIMGIITAIWAALIGALFGGSHFNIIGMTGAFAGIVASYVLEHGMHTIPTLALLSGSFIFLAYIFKLERYMILIPSSVIHGFTLGVALMLFLGQINSALGLHVPKKSTFIANVIESFKYSAHFSAPALLTFCFFFICTWVLRSLLPKVPSALMVTPLSILIGYASTHHLLPFHLDTLGDFFGTITPQLYALPRFYFNVSMITPAAVIASIAILETMLAAKIADVITKTKYNARKELRALGLANIISGLAGGIPASSALARTSFNINAGATNALSGLFCSILMALISYLCISYFTYMPMTAIAAMIMFIAITMVERQHFKRLYMHDKPNLWIALFVACIMVIENPIIGILSGTVMALLLLLYKLATCNYEGMVQEFSNNAQERH